MWVEWGGVVRAKWGLEVLVGGWWLELGDGCNSSNHHPPTTTSNHHFALTTTPLSTHLQSPSAAYLQP